ncbi:MAG: MATE family efflux transporter [Candidatus Cloacimonadales bacterium]
MSQEKSILANPHIGRLLIRLSVPATIGMIVMALYNVVDTIFVGRAVGTLGIAGLAIGFPMQMIILGFGTANGVGSASIISRSLGEGNLAKANRVFGSAMFTVIFLSIGITIFASIFIDPILIFFGATPEILPYAKEYLSIILFGTIFFVFAVTSNNIIRSEGRAKIAMGTMVVSALLNIIFDPIFIFVFDMGIRGAAIATVLSQFISALYLLYFYNSGKSTLHFRWNVIKFDLKLQLEIFKIGTASFAQQIAASFLIIILNHTLAVYGDIYIAVYAIINRILRFVFMPIFGISHGMQPILGFNYGAKRYGYARRVIKFAILHSTLIGVFGLVILYFFSAQIFSLFSNDPALIAKGVAAMRLIVLALPVVGFQVMGATAYQALGRAMPALILSLSRQILVLIPVLLVMNKFFGLTGVWLTMPISDLISSTVTALFFVRLLKILRD